MSLTPHAHMFNGTGYLSLSPGYGLTESSPVTHANPTSNFRYDTIGVAVPGVEYKVREERGRSSLIMLQI